MSQLLPRLTLRLLVPALALGAIAVFADPLPASAPIAPDSLIALEGQPDASASLRFAVALQEEAEALRQEAEAAKKAARQTAAQMRWFLTLPAPNSNRASAPGRAS
jgi:hypothetical protein